MNLLDFFRKMTDNYTSTSQPLEEKTLSNYTETMIARLQASAPLDLAKAQALSAEFGNVTYRSVISKAKSLGLDYVKAQPAKKAKSNEPTKADYLRSIRTAVALPDREGDLTKAELSTILMAIK